ncbi:MAG: restriction endonuclease [Candidatus Bathyarchaeota archaeon]
MKIERDMIISLLKTTKTGPISFDLVKKVARIPSSVAQSIIIRLQDNGLLYLRNNVIHLNTPKRIKLAIRALQLGADLEEVSSHLDWKEFETFVSLGFKHNGYEVRQNFRFKHLGKRWEIDILASKELILVCADCKHWKHGMHRSAMKKIVDDQIKRSEALVGYFSCLNERPRWNKQGQPIIFPAIISLGTARKKFISRVPIIPVLKLQDFLSQLPAYIDQLMHLKG